MKMETESLSKFGSIASSLNQNLLPYEISLVGLGMGNPKALSEESKEVLHASEIIFGASRLLEIAKSIVSRGKNSARDFQQLYKADEIFAFLEKNPRYKKISVVLSGDGGFFSGANAFFEAAESQPDLRAKYALRGFPGISSPVYFAAKLHKSWQSWNFLSLHGASCNLIEELRRNPACFMILSDETDLRFVGERLILAQEHKILGKVKCYLGKNLSAAGELIREISPEEMLLPQNPGQNQNDKRDLYVLLLENATFPAGGTYGCVTPFLKDEDFLRREDVPMTKKEIRALVLSSLELSENSVVYDIGSGSGSVTVEAARMAYRGRVFALDCDEKAFELTKANAAHFCLENVTCLLGKAPEILETAAFPAPSQVFIGGSKGNLSEICRFALEQNPSVRIVADFISLDNLCEMQGLLNQLEAENKIKDLEIKQISVSRAVPTGKCRLMKALNPVYIVSFSGKGGERES